MKRLLSAMALAVIGTVSANAAPVNCAQVASGTGTRTLDAFINLGTDGCLDQDKTYSGFTYAGGGEIDASEVQVTIGTTVLPGMDQHSVGFQPAFGAWLAGFTIGFNIAIATPVPGTFIETVAFDITAPGPFNTSSATMTNTPDGNAGAAFVLNASQTNDDFRSGLSAQSIGAVIAGTPSGGTINQVTSTFFQQVNPVPEPGTLMSIGLGFLALGLYRRTR